MPDSAAMETLMETATSRFFAKYRGVVVDNADPTGRARLRVRVPAVMGEEAVWAMPCVPYAGDGVGFFALPEADTGVWVEFEAGNPSYPIWVGCFWGDGEIPSGDAVPTIKFFRTQKLTIRIDDTSGEIVIENEAGSIFKMTATEITMESQTVTQKVGAKKTTLTPVHFDVHDGAFNVV